MGEHTFTGKWIIDDDTLTVYADKFWYGKESNVILSDSANLDKMRISVNVLRPSEKDKGDTTTFIYYVSVNGNNFVETNEDGILFIDKQFINKIQIRDYLYLLKDSWCLKDSIFTINSNKNNIKLYVAECEFQPPVFVSISKYYKKRKKLYPIDYDSGYATIDKRLYYRKIKED